MGLNYILVLLLMAVSLVLPNRYGRIVSDFIFLGYCLLRYDYGNDYYVYKDYFEQISILPWSEMLAFSAESRLEVLWVLLNYLFSFLSFEIYYWLVSLLIALLFLRVFRKISANNHDIYILITVYVLLDPDILLVSFSTVRQWLAILLSWNFILLQSHSNRVKFILLALVSLIHYSAVIMYFYLLISPSLKKLKLMRLLVSLVVVYLLFPFIIQQVIETFPRYASYIEIFQGKKVNSGLNFIWYLIFGVAGVVVNKERSVLVILFLTFVYFGGTLGILTRLSWYFIIVMPLIISDFIRKNVGVELNVKKILLLGYISFLFAKSYQWFNSITWHEGYFEYL